MDRRTDKPAFTLVELLVVISIIALLIGIALPAFKGARTAAKKTATQAAISAIEAGLQQYREERALGNTYPPSASDARDGNGFSIIKDPVETSDDDVRISGASLLVYGLAGADLQGTRGFKKVGTLLTWAESMNADASNGLYSLAADPPWPKYGPFAGSELIDRVEFLGKLEKFPIDKLVSGLTVQEEVQQVFVDNFGGPILYYKARGAARSMITNPGSTVGIYDFRDNMLLTQYEGSLLRSTRYDDPGPPFTNGFGDLDAADNPETFDGFILDRKASRRSGPDETDPLIVARPVNPDDCLLISPGPDLLYGTKDDVTNWNN